MPCGKRRIQLSVLSFLSRLFSLKLNCLYFVCSFRVVSSKAGRLFKNVLLFPCHSPIPYMRAYILLFYSFIHPYSHLFPLSCCLLVSFISFLMNRGSYVNISLSSLSFLLKCNYLLHYILLLPSILHWFPSLHSVFLFPLYYFG